jgi:transposase
MVASRSAEGTFAGVDWGGRHHEICLIDPAGQVRRRLRVRHDVEGLATLERTLGQAPGPVRIAIERAEGLLVEHLLELPGIAVFCVSPKISARARERYRLASTKSDAFDAFVLADTLRHEHGHWRPLSRPSALTAQIRVLSRDRERIVLAQRAAESRLRATLETYHPAPLHLFSSLDRDISLDFLADYPTPAQAARVGEARMAAFCTRHGYTGRVDPAVLVERLRPHLLSASEGTTAGKTVTSSMFAEQLRLLNTHLRACDKQLAELLAAHPDTPILSSFPGLGPVTAGVLIAEMGDDRARFPAAGALLAESGLAPVTRASGRTRQVRFRYAANHRLRHAVDWWAFTAARDHAWSSAVYQDARARGHGKYRALRGLGTRWMRILWRAWTDHQPYDPARHHAAQTAITDQPAH